MSTASALDSIWSYHESGDYYPQQWRGKLSVDEAYEAQLGILDKRVMSGSIHVGWKVGLTAGVVRAVYDAQDPVFGYLLEDGGFQSGHCFDFDKLYPPLMETEILITLMEDVPGKEASRERVANAIDTIAPAFEVPERRGGGLELDFPLGLVDNVAQRAYVFGEELRFDPGFEFADVELELSRNGEIEARARGADVMDHQLDTVVWLARQLDKYGRTLRAGQRVLSGSFTKPADVNKGDHFRADFSGVGAVEMRFS